MKARFDVLDPIEQHAIDAGRNMEGATVGYLVGTAVPVKIDDQGRAVPMGCVWPRRPPMIGEVSAARYARK